MLEEHHKLERELGPVPPARVPEGLITLVQAAALPELGGAISAKTIRGAIARGDIDAVQPGGPAGTIYVTRTAVLDWIRNCPVPQSPHDSTSAPPATATARSARTARGSSSTAEKKSALAAALKTARELKQR
jgi:hypothetical protein